MDENNIMVRLANLNDVKLLLHGDLSQEKITQKINRGEVFVLVVDHVLAGSLWLSLLWSSVPFIDLIYIDEVYQKQGLSRVLLGFVEEHLKGQGYAKLFSSSQVDEPLPQAWHRHMGFEECGLIAGLNQGGIGELFFRKTL